MDRVPASPDNPLIVHLHIPKNAGTSLSRTIKLRLASWPPARWLHHSRTLGYYATKGWRNRLDRIERLPERSREGIRFFEAHCAYGVHERLGPRARYMTMLRDPIDRTLSMYWFMLADGKRDASMSLDAFLSPEWNWPMFSVDNAQVRYLAGEGGEFPEAPHGRVTRTMLEVAKERLDDRFLLAGVTELFDECMLLLCRDLGWQAKPYGRSNITKKRQRVADLEAAQSDRIVALNEYDSELYSFARESLEERIASLGEAFRQEVDAYKKRVVRHNQRFGGLYSVLPRTRALGQRLGVVRA